MLRTLGRGDETKDEIIDNYVHLLNKQQVKFFKMKLISFKIILKIIIF